MKRLLISLLIISLFVGCKPQSAKPALTLKKARQNFNSKLTSQETTDQPVEEPPKQIFRVVHYESPVGKLAAYLSPAPKDGKKHPVIIWKIGGFSNSIGNCWHDSPPENDQTASAFRKAGILMMVPSVRGGNDNPGVKEGFLGEVDDMLAAAEYLAKQDYIDPDRIYLGGHSTGGTLALLAAELSPRFRAVFSFGPVHDVSCYSPEYLPFDARDELELAVRAPIHWMHCIDCPVFVFEGTKGNIDALLRLAENSTNPKIHFFPVAGSTHFSLLAPVSQMIAKKILADKGNSTNISFTKEELERAMVGK